MSKKTLRVLFVSLLMILTSLAGCIGDSEDSDDSEVTPDEPVIIVDLDNGTINITEPAEPEFYGKIMTSTYHVHQLVSAIVGDTATVEMMSTTNIPVHDYSPTAADLARLADSDAFFYHGLGLEPWVEDTLASLGDDAPPSYLSLIHI